MLQLAASPLVLALAGTFDQGSTATKGSGLGAAALGLLLGLVQLIVGLSIAAYAINKGLQIVSKMLEGIDLWAEVKKKNVAVALLAAGVVVSYTNVISGGINNMTSGLKDVVGGDWGHGIAAILGGALSLVIAISVASFAITVTFSVMDKLTTDIDEKQEFKANNTAIGVVYAGILIGVSGLISAGVSGISSGVTSFLNVLFGGAA